MSLVRAAVAAVVLLSTSARAEPPRESKRISIDVVRADIHDVLRLLAEMGGLNVVVADEVQAQLSPRGRASVDARTNTLIVTDVGPVTLP